MLQSSLRSGAGGLGEGSACSHLLVFFVCSVRRRTLVIYWLKTCQLKMADSSEGFEECLDNVFCILEGKGFKIRLKSEQKKATRQLYAEKDLLALHFVHFKM